MWESSYPHAVAAIDIDGDGRTDLATADARDRRLWVGIGDDEAGWSEEQVWQLAEVLDSLVARVRGATVELAERNFVTIVDARRRPLADGRGA